MPSTTSIESTSYTLKLNANSEKVLNRITNWTKISNASRNQMPVAAFAWPSSGESVAVRAGTGRWSAYRRHRYGGRCCVLPWCSWLLAGTRVCCRRCRRTDVGMPWFLYCWECIFASLLVEWSFTAELSRRESVWLSTVVRCRWPKEVNRFGCDTLILHRNAAWKLSKELFMHDGLSRTDSLEDLTVDPLPLNVTKQLQPTCWGGRLRWQ